MTAPTATRAEPVTGTLLNKVPDVVVWFWIIKVLCTTVGESFVVLSPRCSPRHWPSCSASGTRAWRSPPAGSWPGPTPNHTPRRPPLTQLETAWDDDQATLQPLDTTAWTFLDGQIDTALQAVRATRPDRATETTALTALLKSFG